MVTNLSAKVKSLIPTSMRHIVIYLRENTYVSTYPAPFIPTPTKKKKQLKSVLMDYLTEVSDIMPLYRKGNVEEEGAAE